MTDPLTEAAQTVLNSVKFASIQQCPSELVGEYSRDRLHFELSEDMLPFSGIMVARFWTRILEGKAYNETFTVATREPATWFQHLKLALFSTLFFLWPVSGGNVVPRFIREKFPVRYEERKSTIRFEGHWSYPQADCLTPHVGPVHISEQASVSGPHYEVPAPSRFLSTGEIVNEFYRRELTGLGKFHSEAAELLDWLAHHKVNVDQLVPRNSL
jgi:hypothetical protein